MAALALIAASAASGRSDAASPVTVATVRGPVYAVAQDGARLAWRGCTEVVVRQPTSGRKSRYPIPPFLGASPPCHGIPGRGLALARTRVVWTERTLGMKEYLGVVIATAPGVKPTRLGLLVNDQFEEGDYWGDVVADGDLVVQGRAVYSRDRACLEDKGDPFECPLQLDSGGVWTILPRGARRIPQIPAATTVAVSNRRIAIVPERDRQTLEIRDAATGAVVSSTPLAQPARTIGLSRSVAVAAVAGRGTELVFADPATGAVLRTVPVRAGAAKALTVSGRTVVYANGRRLWRVDALSGRQTVAATAGSAPISFSLEGSRLAWVETSRGVSRVRTVMLG